jgi:transcriptional regulator with XRE-family HTH domain
VPAEAVYFSPLSSAKIVPLGDLEGSLDMTVQKTKIVYRAFGDFISAKRRERLITLRNMAETLGLSAGYYCDIEKNRCNPPDRAVLERLIRELRLSKNDIHIFYDLVGKARSEALPDLPYYINENQVVRVALRLAKDRGNAEDWRRFISDIESRQVTGG